MAQVSYDLNFRTFGTFCGISQKGILVGGKSSSKKYSENTSPGICFFSEFFRFRDFLAVSIKKSQVTTDLGHGR
jgi:hypothetical protein